MSKSLGNSPNPLDLIEKYGADGVRVGMLLCSPAGGDLLFDESLTEQGRNFSNKIWNAFRLVKNWDIDANIEQPESSAKAIAWFNAKLNKTIEELNEQFDQYRLSGALMTLYKLFWDEFSSWYLESIKPEYQKPIDKKTYNETIELFDKLLKLLHPFMPFITEEIWHYTKERKEGESIMISDMPTAEKYDNELLANFEHAKEVVTAVRSIRSKNNIPNKEKLELNCKSDNNNNSLDSIISKLCNLSQLNLVKDKVDGAAGFIIKVTEYFIPLGDKVNVEEEIKKLEKELNYNKDS